ncbi:MAG: family intrarane metalloprotease [Caloramator sp.]|uniref:CPBP family intramembrane glutamic endopeptidase n=1 Tax=Caloramator sp. TaxID=1871330 RepID=UPI001DFF256B|nr:type II CAAX endopeptidase family protein [Caloramator sp.]MBZ4663071.1 family intrarane metalloprotease [Caloramator sp.]
MISFLDLIKELIIFFIIILIPWMVFRRQILNRTKKKYVVIIFIFYVVLSLFTQNLFPFVLVLLILQKEKKRGNKEENKLIKPLGDKKFEIILFSFALKLITMLITALFAIFLVKIGIEPKQQTIVDMIQTSSWIKLVFLMFVINLFAPYVEEFIFRHIFYRNFSRKYGKTIAVLISSALFMLLHFNLVSSIATFSLGVINCIFYDKYGYKAAVLNHFITNFTSSIVLVAIKLLNNVGIALLF